MVRAQRGSAVVRLRWFMDPVARRSRTEERACGWDARVVWLSHHRGERDSCSHPSQGHAGDRRDAADVPMRHTFGSNTVVSFRVCTDEVS